MWSLWWMWWSELWFAPLFYVYMSNLAAIDSAMQHFLIRFWDHASVEGGGIVSCYSRRTSILIQALLQRSEKANWRRSIYLLSIGPEERTLHTTFENQRRFSPSDLQFWNSSDSKRTVWSMVLIKVATDTSLARSLQVFMRGNNLGPCIATTG